MNFLSELFGTAQQWLFEATLQPLLFAVGMGNLLEDGFVATGWLLVGLLQILVMATLFRALERWRPAEPVTDRRAVRVDMVYTCIHRLGLFRVGLFFCLGPLWDGLTGWLRLQGMPTLSLDDLWPGVTDIGWVSFVLYLVLFDAVNYALHRAQHGLGWWWQLHALHHSQRQMTLWSDDRNHLLDDVINDSLLVAVALVVGIPPAQFVGVVAVTRLLESLSHANVRLSFGPLEKLLVSPRFHRRHHAIGEGHESAGAGTLGGCNFAVLFPVWDLIFGTARITDGYPATGVRDQLEGRDYGRGFWAQQWLGLQRLLRPAAR
jgi:sterol desaturase/sphingolipid hydroxylase (fatty acid hydroxylase superfamily)